MIYLVVAIFITLNFFFFIKLKKSASSLQNSALEVQNVKSQNLILEEKIKNFDEYLANQNQKLTLLQQDNNELLIFKGRYEQLQREVNALYGEKDKNLTQIDALNHKILEFEKQKEVLAQHFKRLEEEKQQWEKTRNNALAQLSEELLKKNHEQQEKLTKSSAENISKVTENLLKDFESVFTQVKNLDEKVLKSQEISNQIKSALLTPKAAGDISEITLENILKASNLKEKANLNDVGDYILQSHFSSSSQEGKRPDAILFLPDNNIVIIDSKSSSHFIELFEAKKQGDLALEKNILAKLKESMRKHAESLKKRNYDKFFSDEMHLNNFAQYKVLVIMFLQTEQMLDIICEIDPQFFQRNLENGLVVASPVGLVNLLNQAKFVIGGVKQQENIAELKAAIEKLIGNIALVFDDSRTIGKLLNNSLKSYHKMANRLNRGIYSNIKKIGDLGIEGKKSSEIKLLETYDEESDDNSYGA